MKKLLTISLALLLSAFLNAQNTLVFDRVEYIRIYISSSETFDSESITIASDEVGKLTAVNGHTQSYYVPTFDGVRVGKTHGSDNFPIWVSPGTYSCSVSTSYITGGYSYSFSFLIFKVMPQ